MQIILKDGCDKMDFETVTAMLSKSFWSPGIKIGEIKQAALNSAMVVGAFKEDGTQIAYGRVISDKTRFAYLTDFYVEEQYRKLGIGQQMVSYILDHKDMADVYQWLLVTKDAHEVYKKQGFSVITRPQDYMEIRHPRPEDR